MSISGRGIKKQFQSGIPIVSIVTVSFNAAAIIERTILSVLQLRYPNVEYIIIDGGSTDGTIDVIKKYSDRIDYWVSEKDKGIYDGMNKGIQAANGEWVNFMNCGDHFVSPDALRFFQDTSVTADIVYGNAIVVYPTFRTLHKNSPIKESWKRMPLCHQASFTRLRIMKESPFSLEYKLSSDFDFIYKAYLRSKTFQYIPEIICEFDFTAGASINNIFRSVRERKSIVLKNSFSVTKWIYHSFAIGYVYLAFFTKKTIGTKLTNLVTRLLTRPVR
jgi:glycosyltransferase involved in cell wall biosynthesis